MLSATEARERTERFVQELFGVGLPRGHRMEPQSCPLARLFDHDFAIFAHTIDRMPLQRSAKTAFKSFIVHFDNGKYPDLIIRKKA